MEAPELFYCLLDHRFYRVFLADICFDEKRCPTRRLNEFYGFFTSTCIEISDSYFSAGIGVGLADSAAYAHAATGY
jgi:hypothetical protein